ncbi:gamma-aminobutyric acid type B receptor subunit 2-like [Ornithodoros turicata]|uniref:gamma-aminobutyric acid type B receptor subunit 2-like n=1 Tax=Ornithodoros turicata TaxID=34597 RepID=UPI003138EBA1
MVGRRSFLLLAWTLTTPALAGLYSAELAYNETEEWTYAANNSVMPLFTLPFNDSVEGGSDKKKGDVEDDAYRIPHPFPVVGDDKKAQVVFLLGLFELSGPCKAAENGIAEREAARMAIEHVNERGVIPGYRLEMYDNDTKCDSGTAINAFFHAVYRKQQMTMLLGTSSSEVTETLAKIVNHWGVLQISFGSVSPVLSDRGGFPLFYRTVAPDSTHNAARVAFVRHFRWETVAILHEDDKLYALPVNALLTELDSANISVSTSEGVTPNDYSERIQELKKSDCRIIIASCSSDMARKIFCEVYKQGMYGADFQWIVLGSPEPWWHDPGSSGCTKAQLRSATESVIAVSSLSSDLLNYTTVSGLDLSTFKGQLLQRLQDLGYQWRTMSFGHVTEAYDAVWTAALTLRRAEELWRRRDSPMTLSDFRYEKLLPQGANAEGDQQNENGTNVPARRTRREMVNIFDKILAGLHFKGISEPLSFSGSNRVGITEFQQNRGGNPVKIALYVPDTNELVFDCYKCLPIVWQDGEPPAARRIVKLSVATIQRSVFVSVSVLAVFGMLLALTFLAFNLFYRKRKSIKLSSPKLNNMTVVGCLLVYVAIVFLGLDHETLGSDAHFAVFCTARAFLLSGGFSLAFGAIFIKTYRVHHIFIRASSGVIKNKLLQDQQLIALVCLLVVIDCAIVTLWVTFDPMERTLRSLTMQISKTERDVVYLPQREQCYSEHMAKWLGALYIYKGLLLVVGCYMAWETRNVQIPALNDSQYIGLSVYNAVITSAIVVALANIISVERYTLTFVLVGSLIFVSTTTTLCLLFLPKIHAILSNTDVETVVASSEVRVEFNTRRFAIDERRELFYRAEVQNRAYGREVMELDAEIARLKKLLGEPLIESPGSESLKSDSPLSSLLERFKRKRASLDFERASRNRNSSGFNTPGPPTPKFRAGRTIHVSKIYSVNAMVPVTPVFNPVLRTSNALQAQGHLQVSHSPQTLRGSLPLIITPEDGGSSRGIPHADSYPALTPTNSTCTICHDAPMPSRHEDVDTPSEDKESPCGSEEVVSAVSAPLTNGGSTTDEYRTVSSDDDTYTSCRTFNRGSSSTLGNCSQTFHDAVAEPGPLEVVEETGDESSAGTTPVSVVKIAPNVLYSKEDRRSLQGERDYILKQLDEAEAVDV